MRRIPYAAPSYGPQEVEAVLRVLNNPGQIVAGPLVAEFEHRITSLFGKPFGVMVNSGSSANLLALASLDLTPGAEVITPALTFGTTVAPIVQLGFRPVFVDVGPDTYVIDADQIEAAVTRRTEALMIPSLLGLQPDWRRIREIADRHGLAVIEDSCDTLGNLDHPTDVTTTSFYASHVITCAGGGGMVCFRDPAQAERARLLANWGRASTLFGHGPESEDIDRRFAGDYDAKFLFPVAGYNMQPLELQAAFGLVQLGSLGVRALYRRRNWLAVDETACASAALAEPSPVGLGPSCPLAYPFRVLPGAPFTRNDLARHLEAHGIQTRPIMAGNILRQPGFAHLTGDFGGPEFPNADATMDGGILVGCHQGLSVEDVDYIATTIREFTQAREAA